MSFTPHRDFSVQRLTIGAERAPLLVIDNFLANPDDLIDVAASKSFGDVASNYPGVRSKVPLTFQQFLLDQLRPELVQVFGWGATAPRFTACHFSLVTTPHSQLNYQQRIPHIDSLMSNELALILYLFRADLGGTSFYRHRATGFEYIDQSRRADYWRHVQAEQAAVERMSTGYIDGDTEFYERVGQQDGVFNRMLVYRRTSLHSGALKANFVPEHDPRKGRLSVNGFIA
ncbi:MAG TPA: DUF6445 family protein [Steroidobacteraceae bacterium]|nr:DUF6445 family protein [Steroidobacteraceae bacterium]